MSRINLDQLKTFLCVVRQGGVRRAATAMHLTQPAVTARIRNLEDSLGCALFDRSGGTMRLTKRGERLLRYAEEFEHLTELVARDVIDPAGLDGHLRLGVSETIAQCWLPDLITRLHRHYPKLEIEFNVDISSNLRAGLMDQEIDLAILLGPISEHTVENIDLPGFALAWYVAADAPDLPGAAFLGGRPVLTYARNTRPYREIRAQLIAQQGPGVAIFPSSSLSACFRLVEANLGVAALPRALGAPFVAQGRIREFDPGWHPNPLRFTASYMGEPRSQLAETAARMARDVAMDYDKAQARV